MMQKALFALIFLCVMASGACGADGYSWETAYEINSAEDFVEAVTNTVIVS